MPVTSLSPVTNVTQTTTPAASSAGLGQHDFMQLLVTQLQHQDPLNPMDDKEFISQMAQLSTLEATTNLSKTIQGMASSQQQMQALQMVGHTVQYADSSGNTQQGAVSAVLLDASGPSLVIGNGSI